MDKNKKLGWYLNLRKISIILQLKIIGLKRNNFNMTTAVLIWGLGLSRRTMSKNLRVLSAASQVQMLF